MLINLTVIYFAFGAPLGVYGIIRSKGTSPHQLAINLSRFLFWPFFAAVSVRDAFVFQPQQTSLEERIESMRTEFEAEIDRASIFEFRDAFARYTGLAMAAASDDSGSTADELLKIANRRPRAAAKACLARRNGRRLAFHLLQARNDFLDIVATNPTNRTRHLTSRLGELLSDLELH